MRVGDVLGRYRVTDVIGRGGMAVVYAGQHQELGGPVAIKVLHPDHLSNPVMERRFINEARALAAIRHPGIVELLDAGCTPEGRGYLVMELLDGESLAERLERGPLPLPQAIAFGRQLASALAAAHQQGIVHRDLKPANILLCPDLDVHPGERAKLLDFGIAKRIEPDTPAPITASGLIIGTPEYMSPEQCRGDDEIDARSDIYCLGLVLYHMVTGQYPFESSGETREILAQHLYGQSEAPSRLDPTVPAALSRVIARCMAKLPARRYQHAAELDRDLGEVEKLIGVHEVLSPTHEIEGETRPLPAPEAAPTTMLQLTRETPPWRPTWFRRIRDNARELCLAAVGLFAAGTSALAIRSGDRAGALPEARADRPAPVAAARAPAPAPAPLPDPPPADAPVVASEPAPPPPLPLPAREPVAPERRAEPRRHAKPAPRSIPRPTPPPARKVESYEDVETPVVY